MIDLLHHRRLHLRIERRATGDQVVEHRTERVHVGARIDGVAVELLGRHVGERADAIAGLNTAYSAAVLGSWRRAGFIGALLVGLYAVLYILLSLEAFSLLIGSLLLFAALAGVMYATRRIDWGAKREPEAT